MLYDYQQSKEYVGGQGKFDARELVLFCKHEREIIGP